MSYIHQFKQKTIYYYKQFKFKPVQKSKKKNQMWRAQTNHVLSYKKKIRFYGKYSDRA